MSNASLCTESEHVADQSSLADTARMDGSPLRSDDISESTVSEKSDPETLDGERIATEKWMMEGHPAELVTDQLCDRDEAMKLSPPMIDGASKSRYGPQGLPPCDNGTLFDEAPVAGTVHAPKRNSTTKVDAAITPLSPKRFFATLGQGFKFIRPMGGSLPTRRRKPKFPRNQDGDMSCPRTIDTVKLTPIRLELPSTMRPCVRQPTTIGLLYDVWRNERLSIA